MKHYALTGGIGSGKSTVLALFGELGVPTFSADDSAKMAMEQDAAIKAKITALFGEVSYAKGKLNRPFIAEQVFGNKEKLQQLNSLSLKIQMIARESKKLICQFHIICNLS